MIEDESVLVHTPLEVDGAALEAGVGEGMPCESCGAAGCISCCDGGVGCTGHGRRSGWHTAAGYFNRVLGDDLKVMDAAAVALCRDNKIPIVVFNIRQPGNLAEVIEGRGTATVVKGEQE